jgi:hypothetical protein
VRFTPAKIVDFWHACAWVNSWRIPSDPNPISRCGMIRVRFLALPLALVDALLML